jgi:hypothetical protein
MGDLSPFIPQQSAVVDAIYALHKAHGDEEKPRRYLGASIIGHECDRALWFAFRQCVGPYFDANLDDDEAPDSGVSGRMYRLFQTGQLAEARFAHELKAIGCEVITADEKGEQFGVEAIGGHFKGHMDGVARGVPDAPKTWHVCEFKTFNDARFKELKKMGVKVAKPLHYAQMQVYMGLGKMDRALYLAVNKNDDSLYSERIEYSATAFKGLMARAERIIKAQQPPDRFAKRQDDFRCRFCDAKKICWGAGETALPISAKTCRTCCHATPEMDAAYGRWSCRLKREMKPCENHLIIPGILTFCEPVDAGADWIEFKNTADGALWRHGANREEGHYSTDELIETPGPIVGSPALRIAKDKMGGVVSRVDIPELSLIERYPPKDCELIWESEISDDHDPEKIPSALSQHCSGLNDTDKYEDEKVIAVEYGGQFLLVMYKTDNYAAIWRGKE